MMVDLMPKKNYDLTEITRLLLEMRENCIPKAGNAYEDPNRAEKYDALNAAIDLINNPSMISRWISVKDRLPEEGKTVLVCFPDKHWVERVNTGRYTHCHNIWYIGDVNAVGGVPPTHWMPLPEPPKEES